MENIILVIHLILAVSLIAVVLLQRSEGGGLGIGGGGGDGAMSGRSAANALGTLTWILAIGFIATSISLTVLAAKNAAGDSVIERLGSEAAVSETPSGSGLDGSLLPPVDTDAPATPPKATEEPAVEVTE
ncbi:MAG: preprotein translocase subunit SecG [Paracoccaceae bacterium]|jgi:preprotein translocase subunit SecG